MLKKGMLVVFWFPLTTAYLLLSLTMLSVYAKQIESAHPLSAVPPSESAFQLTAAAGTSQIINTTIEAGDARVLLVESFLRTHKSPMAPFAGIIVAEADRFGLDFRLVPAIAMCESNAGKRMPKKAEYNFAGIAVYTGQNHGKAFSSWPHAISWVSQYIKEKYYDKGITDLRDIGAIWAPPSVNTGYSWSNCVESFTSQII